MGFTGRWIWVAALLLSSAVHAQAPRQTAAPAPVAAAQPANTPNPAGTINLVEGDARILTTGARPRAAKVSDVVSEGDVLVTGKDGEVHLTMQDTGFIALRPDTRLRVVSYKADGAADDEAIFRLLAGGFRSVTGWIGKFNMRAYQVRTPNATIGIRGTDHEPHYIPAGSAEGEPGTYDKVYVGSTVIETPGGTAAVAPAQAGFFAVSGRDRPRVLARIPGFFRASRYEPMIEQKHAEIQQHIAQRRDERRKLVAEKRAELDAARVKTRALLEQNKAAAEERRKAAQERRKDAQGKREELKGAAKSTQQLQKDAQEKRKALQEQEGAGQVPGKALREQRKAVREASKAAQAQRTEVQEDRKALQEGTKAAAEQRLKAVESQRNATQDQLKDMQGKRKSLQDERKDMRDELKSLREQERQRYREELKAARKKGAGPSGADKDEKAP
jgi:hypothetical protein